MRYPTLLLCVGCAHLYTPIDVDEDARPAHDNAYSDGHLPGSMVAKTILGSGAISLSATPMYMPNGTCYVPSLPCSNTNGQVLIYYSAPSWNFYAGGAVRIQISNGTGAITIGNGGASVGVAATSFTVNTDIFAANTTQVLARSNSLTQFSVGTAGSAWLDVQSTGVAAGVALSTASGVDITSGHSFLTSSTTGGVAVTGVGGVYQMTQMFMKNTAPTISSGFGASPSITTSNGTAAFTVNVGTGGVATSGVIGLPAASNGWVCSCDDLTQASTSVNKAIMTAQSTTTCTVTNKNMSTGAAAAWAASDILHCMAMGR